jgi:phosphomannomutase
MQARFPASGEINLKLADAARALAALREKFGAGAKLDETDGVSLDHGTWRVNVRSSNTEPVVRVNVESRGDPALMRTKTDEVLAVLKSA